MRAGQLCALVVKLANHQEKSVPMNSLVLCLLVADSIVFGIAPV